MSTKKPQGTPLLYSYLKKYQENPTSRVFAPLAEAYRKAGLLDDALEIAREGVRMHPSFIGGRVALARALFDKKQYQEVIQALEKHIHDAPDNLIAQRLLGDSNLLLGRVAEALGNYKLLLYYSPQDTEVGNLVRELEMKSYESGTLLLTEEGTVHFQGNQEPEPEYFIKHASEAIEGDSETKVHERKEKREQSIRKVEKLQSLLLRIEHERLKAPLV